MKLYIIITLCVLLTITVNTCQAFDITSLFKNIDISSSKKLNLKNVGMKLLTNIKQEIEKLLVQYPNAVASEYPYFNFFPMLKASVIPDSNVEVKWKGNCFTSTV